MEDMSKWQHFWRQSTCLKETFSAYDFCFVTAVALVFSFYQPLLSSVINTIKSYLKTKHTNPEVLSLGAEVQSLKSELAHISPTAEFSSYFKTERILNKKLEEYDAADYDLVFMFVLDFEFSIFKSWFPRNHLGSQIFLVAKERMMQPSQMKIEMGVKVFAQGVGLLLLHFVSGINAFCIPSSVFWPLNRLLRFPTVWNSEGCIPSMPDLTPVSLFVVAYCTIAAGRKMLSLRRI